MHVWAIVKNITGRLRHDLNLHTCNPVTSRPSLCSVRFGEVQNFSSWTLGSVRDWVLALFWADSAPSWSLQSRYHENRTLPLALMCSAPKTMHAPTQISHKLSKLAKVAGAVKPVKSCDTYTQVSIQSANHNPGYSLARWLLYWLWENISSYLQPQYSYLWTLTSIPRSSLSFHCMYCQD